MSTCWTFCLDCEEFTNHRLVTKCPHCGSKNVEQDSEALEEEELEDEEIEEY